MLENHEVNKTKDLLIEIMLTGKAEGVMVLTTDAFEKGLVEVRELSSELRWYVSDRGKRWLNKYNKGEQDELQPKANT